jgi:hypothetical protein
LSDSLATLEQQRSGILMQILELGDFRSGSITAINGRAESQTVVVINPTSPVTARTSV